MNGNGTEARKAVVLLSGGIDSSTLLHHVSRNLRYGVVHALSFAYGQKHARELEMAGWQAQAAGVARHEIVDLALFRGLIAGASALTAEDVDIPRLADLTDAQKAQPPTYVPHRNLLFLTLAAAYAEARGIADVFYGAQAQDRYGYWDCTEEFRERLNTLLQLNRGRPVTVLAPFMGLRKADELRIGRELGVDYGHTWSCYRGAVPACGHCPTCVERLAAFAELGVPDPLPYAGGS